MALVPSGKLRIMEKQSFLGDWDVAAPKKEMQLADVKPRSEIEQSQITPEGNASKPPEMNQQTALQQPQQSANQPKPMPQPQVDPNKEPESAIKVDFTDERSAEDFDPDAAQTHYMELLKKNSLLVRQISRKDETKLFKKNFSSDGIWSGQFFVPGTDETGANKFGAKAAAKLMMEFCKKFRLKGDMQDEPGGNGHIIKWTSQSKATIVGPGGAMSDFLQGNNGEKKTGSLTMGEMLTARRNSLYETMRNIAKGNK